jgi:two-component system cell cycle response regulator
MRVLVAEDSVIYRKLIESALANHYELVFVNDGESAWDVVQQPDPPKLLLFDWVLPELDGIELCRKIRDRLWDHYPYIVLLTARSGEADLLMAMDAGVDEFIKKPFSAPELLARLKVGSRIVELHQQLTASATYDSLTHVRNRAAVLSSMQFELERCRREKKPLGLIFADIDKFKTINDTAGHLAGDEVIQAVAMRITEGVRSYDIVGRYGGDEFLVCLPGASCEIVNARAEEIRGRISSLPMKTKSGDLAVTVSIGATVAEAKDTTSLEDLLHRADEALYRAKGKGRNMVEL